MLWSKPSLFSREGVGDGTRVGRWRRWPPGEAFRRRGMARRPTLKRRIGSGRRPWRGACRSAVRGTAVRRRSRGARGGMLRLDGRDAAPMPARLAADLRSTCRAGLSATRRRRCVPPMPGIEVRISRLRASSGSAAIAASSRRSTSAQAASRAAITARWLAAISGVEGLGEAGLLHGDKLGQLAAARGKRLERDRFGRRRGAEALGHGASKARDEAGVQPVGLGDAPLGGAEGAHLARVGERRPRSPSATSAAVKGSARGRSPRARRGWRRAGASPRSAPRCRERRS